MAFFQKTNAMIKFLHIYASVLSKKTPLFFAIFWRKKFLKPNIGPRTIVYIIWESSFDIGMYI
jgi:hypothetical protein